MDIVPIPSLLVLAQAEPPAQLDIVLQDGDGIVAALPPVAQTEMTAEELQDLVSQETTIAAGLGTFRTVGEAMARINERRLYRQDYATFSSYLQARWDIKTGYAYQIMAAAKVVTELSAIADIVPTTESQARPLTKLDPSQREAVWTKVVTRVNNGETLTAKLVGEVVGAVIPAEPEELNYPINPIIDESFQSGYLYGDWSELVKTIVVTQIGMVLIPRLDGDTPEQEADSLSLLLAGIEAMPWASYHVLVVTRFDDYRDVIETAENTKLAFGGTITWASKQERKLNDWSFPTTKRHILHFRRGNVSLVNPCGDIVECECDPGTSGPPVALVRELVNATTTEGTVVLVAPGGNAAASMICSESNRRCIEIEDDIDVYTEGNERLEIHAQEVKGAETGGAL